MKSDELQFSIKENNIVADFGIDAENKFHLCFIGLNKDRRCCELEKLCDEYSPAFLIGTIPGHGFMGKRHGRECEQYSYQSHKRIENDLGQKLEVVLSNGLMEVTLHYQFFRNINVVRTYSTVKNISRTEQLLLYITSFHLSNISYPEQIMIVNNGWCTESDVHFFSPDELGLLRKSHGVPSKKVFISNIGTQSTKEYLPIGQMDKMMWQIESNTSWEWEIADAGKLYLALSGPSDESGWSKTLKPGQEFESVKAAIVFGDDFNDLIAEMTKYRRIIKGKNGPFFKQPVIFNDFNNCLMADPTYEKEIPCIDAAAKIGAEYYCVDGGWFTDGYWWDGVGEWKEPKERFHGKLKEIFERIVEKGMKPGIWLEPEVMGTECPAAKLFSDDCFFMRHGKRVIHRDRYQFDFRNKKVIDYLNAVVDRLIADYRVSFFKFDYNIDAGTGTEVNADSFGDGLFENGKAYLAWVKSVMSRYPEIVIESCASGGQRMDYATLSVFPLQSTSDQENYIDTSLVSANAPIGILPEQTGIWTYPLANQETKDIVFNMLNSMRNCMYISGEIMKLNDDQLMTVKDGVDLYKKIRHDIKDAIPFFPLGVSSYHNPIRCVGYDCKENNYIILWNASNDDKNVEININSEKLKMVYPQTVKTELDEGKLGIYLNGISACMVVY